MEQNYPKTSLSVGATLRAVLVNDGAVSALCGDVIPVAVAPETRLPYIVYRRTELLPTVTKSGYPASDAVAVEVLCCAADYAQSIAMAEAARRALETCREDPAGCVKVRSMRLETSEETFEGDAYIQSLTFRILV